VLPAVNVTEVPDVELRVPIEVGAYDQVYVIPEPGHVEVHVGLAVKDGVVPPADTVCVAGVMDTPVSAFEVMVMIAELLIAVTPSRVALTIRPTLPAVLPAVTVVELPAAELTVPMEGLVSAHE
jgi:hypothetical protein